MFLFIPLGMLIALILYQRFLELFARLPLPGIVPKDMVLEDFESHLKLVLSGWYAIYFHSCFSLASQPFQRCHAHISILVCVVSRADLIIIIDTSQVFCRSSGSETHWVVPALAGIVFGYSYTIIFLAFLA